ncbi:MAG: hypothetical protein UX91_C0001G0125 [Candidatus Amesbacteria bacterium GW2011_GWB1_47_19]|nr:MAG: hypothetical protein UW51_C0001G0125 [Candidatus Amesbacteria bacterium GW2011_GWA1_44_24]KKU32137.1 MAG: hypothetical protein UX46_C0001G0124 [Candidatus Amesbacteria bacterium GW2011_GWC1_46_24]KKU67821.1 MAG: hypothetical protein UX91_C0001G0125 [Candidatus Amesbacteria bacterium GW2011_GWB1_47_19]OGD05016.1 MAG: hypothetical protein A2379_03890 [Candidatus Amesbacteria bacterium RIFOXYB1_FULL_47_13]HBC72421.1 hypothetical protein [Candidatus Amesbacteria bacterium]
MFGIFGSINSPFSVLSPGRYTGAQGQGLIVLVSNLVKLMIVLAGVYAFFNIIMAGWGFLTAGSEPKNIARAWEKIWQSVLGLVIIAASFLIAWAIGYIVFGPTNAYILFRPRIWGP